MFIFGLINGHFWPYQPVVSMLRTRRIGYYDVSDINLIKIAKNKNIKELSERLFFYR